jgi:hypothetical protein
MKAGMIPSLKLGGYDLQAIPAIEGAPIGDVQQNVDVDLGGVLGAGLLALFRVTFADEGRYVWLEPDPTMGGGPPAQGGSAPAPAPAPVPVPVPVPAPTPKGGK